MAASLMIGGQDLGAVGPGSLAEHLASLQSVRRAEVWLKHAHGSSLCLLKSDGRAMLMLVRAEGDAGLVSRADEPVGDADLHFTLSNGQEDTYPATWTIAFDDARRVMEHFWFGGTPAPFIKWHDGNV